MFGSCSSLTSLDLSSFDIKNVTKIFCIFQYCSKLKFVKINNIDSNMNLKSQLPSSVMIINNIKNSINNI